VTRRRSSPALRCWQAAGTAGALVLLGCVMDGFGRFVLAPLLAWIGGGR
jgi:hypothetical protein